MSLSITNNIASLTAQQNLNKTSSALSTSLERLSTGLKINSGADGPAALVISEQQRAQIAGLNTAIDNTSKAVAVVQTGEGALNEVNSLLTTIRGLALDSANSGVNDSTALAANQAEIANALSTIDNIAKTTKFGSKNLLDGSAALAGAVAGTNAAGLSNVVTGSSTTAGNYAIAITAAGTGGAITGAAGVGALTTQDSLTIGGGGLSGNVSVALDIGDNATTSAGKIQTALDNATGQGGGAGKFAVSVDSTGKISIKSNILGTGSGAITVAGSTAAIAVTGLSTTGTAGTNLAGTVSFNGGAAATFSAVPGPNGLNNQVSIGGTNGLNFSVNVANGTTAGASTSTIAVADNSLVFQIGANANETAKVSIDKATSDSLAVGVSGLTNAATTDLSKIDVTTQNGAQDAIKVVDAAIAQVSNLRGKLGAFQSNTLEANSANLSTTLTNTTAAESVVRDTDFASEIANYTKLQTQVQAGSTVLSNANQLTSQIALLLQKA